MGHPKLATAQSGYGGRGYYIPGDLDAAGKRRVYPSVTTCLKQVNKPGLHQWISDQVAAFAVANIRYLENHTEDAGWEYLRFIWSRTPDLQATELRTWHEGVRDDAAELGTNLHEWMDAFMDGLTDPPELDSPEAEEMAEQVELWLERHTVEVRRSEFTIVNRRLNSAGYAGTADGWWIITCHDPNCVDVLDSKGQPTGVKRCCMPEVDVPFVCLVDIKTSRFTWPEHGMQLAALSDADVVMREVAPGYSGAKVHTATVKGQKVQSWWIEEEPPTYERLVALHVRPSWLDSKGVPTPAFCRVVDFTKDKAHYAHGFAGAHMLAETYKALG